MTGKDAMSGKVLLIRPPTVTTGTSFIGTQFPMNVASIAASLAARGHDVRIWDFDVEPFIEMSFGKRLEAFVPDIVGISCYTPTIPNGHKIASAVKRSMPKLPVVVGGPHVSALPEDTLGEFPDFDIGVIGEGEETMAELTEKLLSGSGFDDVKGIIYRHKGSPIKTQRRTPVEDLDQLPFPARHLLDIPHYKGQSYRGFSRSFLKITEMMTSRGCPNRCIFCASDVVSGKTVRFRTAASVKAEIEECISRYGFNHFTVSDDTFTLKEERLYDICEEFAKLGVTWNCNARVWPISKKILKLMADSGCTGVTFGVESGSPRILKLIKKNVTVEQIEDAFRWSREAGIKLIEADAIIGSHPSETASEVKMTQALLRRIQPDIIMVSVIVPYPGTEVYDIMRERRLIFDDRRWDSFILFGREPMWRTENFTPGELMALQRRLMLSFYFRPFYALGVLRKTRSLKEALYWISGGMDFLLSCLKGMLKRIEGRGDLAFPATRRCSEEKR
jgi:radical SAM superfamily enzyme YgiQ (UPF0313 family)